MRTSIAFLSGIAVLGTLAFGNPAFAQSTTSSPSSMPGSGSFDSTKDPGKDAMAPGAISNVDSATAPDSMSGSNVKPKKKKHHTQQMNEDGTTSSDTGSVGKSTGSGASTGSGTGQ